ncbi:glycoside hydrolase family 25 protein [Streptomyces sp. NPDC056160]|uniref:glycoside hydrolase family 25 protein n=1 Tax=Streptomyces sp. NPDC056160 TaxID=3345731 RepID=UPI0035DA3A5E
MTVKGIDVSAYQSATYDTSGLDFVFTKITEGLSYINPRWAAQRNLAKARSLVWGAYHYPHMANDPRAEADYFLKQVAWKPGDIIVLDWEGYDSANTAVPKARQVAYRDTWLKYVKGKMPGHRVGIYCNTDYWRNVDTSSNCGDFLWIATAGQPAGHPGIAHAWTFHQYSANDLDHDVANFPSRAALAAWAAGTTPEENTMDAQDVWGFHGKLPDGKTDPSDTLSYTRGTNKAVKELSAQLGALTAAVAALAKGGGLTAAEVQAAAETGAQAALDRLADALKEA